MRVQVLRRQPDGSWLRIIDRPEVTSPSRSGHAARPLPACVASGFHFTRAGGLQEGGQNAPGRVASAAPAPVRWTALPGPPPSAAEIPPRRPAPNGTSECTCPVMQHAAAQGLSGGGHRWSGAPAHVAGRAVRCRCLLRLYVLRPAGEMFWLRWKALSGS